MSDDAGPSKTQVMLEFQHGLGDAVQLSSFIAHLNRYHPDWDVHVTCYWGKHSAVYGIADKTFFMEDGFRNVTLYKPHWYRMGWPEPREVYSDSPSTKVEFCLRTMFQLQPIPDLCRYTIHVGPQKLTAAADYLSRYSDQLADGRYATCVIHYEGNTSAANKNLSHDLVAIVCDLLANRDPPVTPIILDWDRRSPLPDNQTIFCPDVDHELWDGHGTGDAETIAALIGQSQLCIAVDSGPQKVAGATDTPTIAVWTRHHPVHYYGLDANVLHLVPENHRQYLRGSDECPYFDANYRHHLYTDLRQGLVEAISRELGTMPDLTKMEGIWVRTAMIPQDMVIVRDVFKGDSYHIRDLSPPAEIIVDVGAHIGTFAKRWRQRNPSAWIFCIEASPDNIPALEANVGDFARVIHAACTYEADPVLLNSVRTGCTSTGGSHVVSSDAPVLEKLKEDGELRLDRRRLPSITIEGLLERFGLTHIDVLKMDCEGSEYSILENTTSLDRIGLIMGEYHREKKFKKLVASRFSSWQLRVLDRNAQDDNGTFWLTNPRRLELPK